MNAAFLIERTCALVAAYVSRNHVSIEDLPTLVARVYGSIARIYDPFAASETQIVRPTSAQIGASIGQEYLISFLDGKSYRSLKRHLAVHGLTPELYRANHGLPFDYPMVAPGYAAVRSRIAKQIGLGRKGP